MEKRYRLLALITAAALFLSATVGALVFFFNEIDKIINIGDVPSPNPIVFNGGAYTAGVAELPDALKTVSVTAEGTDSKIMPLGGSFVIKTAGLTDVKTLTDYIKITPAINTSVEKIGDTEFKVTPVDGELTPGSVYKVTVGDPENPAISYAFQTETKLKVKSILPADRATNVPVNNGIEITFSDSVMGSSFKDYISVEPAVSGSFVLYSDGRTVAFVPDKNLEYDTIYTVNVKAGIKGLSGLVTEDDTAATFRTYTKEYEDENGGKNKYKLYVSTNISNDNIFSPGMNATVSFNTVFSYPGTYNKGEGVSGAYARLYAFKSADDALKAICDKEANLADSSYNYDTSKLTYVGKYTGTIVGNYGGSVDFGTELAMGVYLAEINVTAKAGVGNTLTEKAYAIVQISNLRPYTFASEGKFVLWVNQYGTGAMGGDTVKAETFKRYDGFSAASGFTTVSGTTDKNGLITLDTGKNNAAVVEISNGNDYCLIFAALEEQSETPYFIDYVYTDREVYFTNDKVNFWGVVLNSYTGEIPSKIYLQTGNSNIKTPVTLNGDGSFNGSYAIENQSAGYYYLKFTDGDGNVYAYTCVEVTESSKPQYTASLEFDKAFYRRGETGIVTLSASFFDGTPVEGLDFIIQLQNCGDDKNVTVTTDKNGEATVKFTTGQIKTYWTSPVYISAQAELVNFETQVLRESTYAAYYHSEYILDTAYGTNGNSVKLNYRDFSNIGQDETGAPAKGKISYTLYKYVITRFEEKVYNKYLKKNVTYTSSKYSESVEKSGSLEFVNGVIDLPLYEVTGFEGGYYYKISFYDDTSRNTYETTISAVKNNRFIPDSTVSARPELVLDKDAYCVGDTIFAQYKVDEAPVSALFALFADGLKKVDYTDKFEAEYDKSMVPGAGLYAVNFDPNEGTYYMVKNQVAYDYSANAEIKFTVSTDKRSYKPGETAVLSFHAENASGAKVLVSIVDEACFALGDQSVSVAEFFKSNGELSTLGNVFGGYSYYYYNRYYSDNDYTGGSYKPVTVNGRFYAGHDSLSRKYSYDEEDVQEAAADGNSGNVSGNTSTYIRKYFADNPEFTLVTLDKDGNGTLVITVPDNITTWRITACAYAGMQSGIENAKFGFNVSDTVCTQPFFMNLTATDAYIVGDTISIGARSYGSAASGKVQYRAVLYSADGQQIATATASADSKQRAWLKFSKQDAGQYYVVVYAKCGDYTDAVQQNIQVIESAVSTTVRKFISVADLKTIKPKYYPVTLTIINPTAGGELYDRVTSRLMYGDDSSRSDMLVAQYIAKKVSDALYGNETGDDELAALQSLLANYGGTYAKLLQYSEDDIYLTAQILTLCPEAFKSSRRNGLVSSCYSILASQKQESPESLCATLACLSALGEPVLDRLYAVSGYAAGYSAEAKLYLALAFANLGDYSAARTVLESAVDELVTDDEYGTAYVKANTLAESVKLSGLALFVTSRTDRQTAAKLAAYLMANGTKEESPRLALACYLRFFLPTDVVSEKSFTYKAGGISEIITLKSGRAYTLTLNKNEFESLEFTSFDEGLKLRASYRGSLEEAIDGENNGAFTIEKKIEPYKDGMYRVTLTLHTKSTRISECFDLTDTIPSGCRFVSLESGGYNGSYGTVWTNGYVRNSNGQTMSGQFWFYNQAYSKSYDEYKTTVPEYEVTISVSYIIRGAVEGEYVCEPAFVRKCGIGSFAVSSRYLITVKENSAWKIK